MNPASVLENARSLQPIISAATEAECHILLEAEKRGRKRKSFILRIHSRLNFVRAQRERKELVG